jgi:hypothetical protein
MYMQKNVTKAEHTYKKQFTLQSKGFLLQAVTLIHETDQLTSESSFVIYVHMLQHEEDTIILQKPMLALALVVLIFRRQAS